ncbi:hypothetical protein [Virgibacillus salexigens]|uniref:hypothetical protein n=1 Tax=Virgibacillus salexigens TaxID=61016 RepID=UPI003081AEE5
MEHPVIARIMDTGYPVMNHLRNENTVDALGNDVFSEDDILVLEDQFFLVDSLSEESKEVLELLGATYEEAQ